MALSAQAARAHLEAGKPGPLSVDGRLDLTNTRLKSLPQGIACYELDASSSALESLPSDLQVESRLILDNCQHLRSLPAGLEAGAISLRNCNSLHALPEGLETWFLDLSESKRFTQWPREASVHSGRVRLRNCIDLQSLPSWFGTLATLDLAGCVGLTSVPDGIRVTGWIDIGGTNITSLPPSLCDAQLHWRSVPITHRIAFEPQSITAKEAINEQNAEIRRVMIERMGYLRFAQEAGAKVLDTDTDPGGERRLLHIELEQDEPLVGLACACPSTGHRYFLRVPPSTKSCHQAAAWLAGFDDPALYHPVIET
ncbi:MAG: DUF6745 domain-containing protein [Polyangiaceae bacterium]